ncbi:MAG: DUF2508 family protein [Clostridiales bacterium]|nr:DUF2508 family protein [Clostridiales bacterium]
MTEVLRWLRRPQETEEERERAVLTNQLHETRCAIQRTYLQFNSTGDPDLIDAAVFDLKAEQARYSYLLRRLKSLDRSNQALKAE